MSQYRKHDQRLVQALNGTWDFHFLGDVEPDAVDIQAIRFTDYMAVPGCFDATPAYAGKRGLVAYRTSAMVTDVTRHRLVFESVHHWCRVFIDGRRLGDHAGGFTRFQVDFTPQRKGEIEILVLVDNRLDQSRSPLHKSYYDWYQFGGIARPVALHRLGNCWINTVRCVTNQYRSRSVSIAIEYGSDRAGSSATLTFRCGGLRRTRKIKLESSGVLAFDVNLKGLGLWSPEQPILHDVYVSIDGDDYRQRFGIRQVQVRGRHILLNGKPRRLTGFCRHESHPQFGHALPETVMLADLQILRDMGCNFIRGSHYPQDERFLELCDATGMMVWCESTGWQQNTAQLTDPDFMAALQTCGDEMVSAAFNHPSVIMWGVLNESQTDRKECRPAFERLLNRLRELDPTRPVTFADCTHEKNLMLDLPDIVAINCYPGWYQKELADVPAELDRLIDHVKSAGQGDKPVIISEIGAEALWGWRDWNEQKWTEQYQSKLLESAIRHLFMKRKDVAGLAIWQFCDIRTYDAQHRGRGFNNKGVVDEYRRPKVAFETVKRLFRGLHAARGDKDRV